jgi:tetratricopeptide (TPR) repeat protein
VPAEKDYYQILGVPRDATQEQIKRRYRELVRRYHPDVNPDKTASHQLFVEISEAYRVLSDPSMRAAYNLELDRRRSKQQEEAATRASSSPRTGPSASRRQQYAQHPIERMVENAAQLFAQRRYNDAAALCRQIIARDRTNARAYTLLGDVYYALGRIEDAIVMYSYAHQYAPNDAEVVRKLNRALAVDEARMRRAVLRTRALTQTPAILMSAGWVTAAVLFLLSFQSTPPLTWFSVFDKVPGGSLLLLMADTGLVGLLLAAGNALGRFEDEMFFSAIRRGGHVGPPVGLFVPLAAILCFWVALAFYLIYAWMQEHFSASVGKAFGICLVMVGLFSLPHPEAAGQLFLWGAGPAFCTFCFGWLVADTFRPNWSA